MSSSRSVSVIGLGTGLLSGAGFWLLVVNQVFGAFTPAYALLPGIPMLR